MNNLSFLALDLGLCLFAAACAPPAGGGTGGSGGSDTGGSGAGGSDAPEHVNPWHKQLSGISDQESMTMTIAESGRVIVAGFSDGTADLGLGPVDEIGVHDLFVTAFSPEGDTVFARRFGAFDVLPTDIATDADGNIVLTGYFGDGALAIGQTYLFPEGARDGFIAKLDPTGAPLWARRFGTAEDAFSPGGALAIAGNGDILMAGNKGSRLTVMRLSPEGEVLFENDSIGTMDSPFSFFSAVQDAAIAPNGDLFVTGSYTGNATLGAMTDDEDIRRVFVARLSGADGQALWARAYGEKEGWWSLEGSGLVVDAQGNPILAGSFAGALDFGGSPLSGALYVAKLDGLTGAHVWSRGLPGSRISLTKDAYGNPLASVSTYEPVEIGAIELEPGTFLLSLDADSGKDLHVRPVPELGELVSESENGFFGTGALAVGPTNEVALMTSFYGDDDTTLGPIASAGWGDILIVQLGTSW